MIKKVLKLNQDGRLAQADVWASPNFSFEKIELNQKLEIPQNQQMLLNGFLKIEGELSVFGKVIFLDLIDDDTVEPPIELPPDNFSYTRILVNEEKTIPSFQQMNVFGGVEVFGQLNVLGRVTLTESYQLATDPLEFVHEQNFNYETVESNQLVKIPNNQQMSLFGQFNLRGTLNLLGSFALASLKLDEEDDYLPPYLVEDGEKYFVKKNRSLQVPRSFVLNGTIENFGMIFLGGLSG